MPSCRHGRRFDGGCLVFGDFHAHFFQRFLLDLPDAFARDAQPVADFFQRFGPAIIQSEPHGQNPVFPGRKRGQNFSDQCRVVLLDQPVERRRGVRVRHHFGNLFRLVGPDRGVE